MNRLQSGSKLDSMCRPIANENMALVNLYRKTAEGRRRKRKASKHGPNTEQIHPSEQNLNTPKGELEVLNDKIESMRRKIYNAQKELSIFAIEHIRNGFASKTSFDNAYHYVQNESLTALCEHKRLFKQKNTDMYSNAKQHVFGYGITSGYVRNIINENNKEIELDTFTTKCEFVETFDTEDVDLPHIADFCSHYESFKNNFRYSRLALFGSTHKQHLKNYMKQELEMFNIAASDTRLGEIVQIVYNSWSNDTAFKFSKPIIREFSANDYKISLLATSGEYIFAVGNRRFGIFIDRRMVLSCLAEDHLIDGAEFNIPLCEEIIVRLKYEGQGNKFSDTESYMIISARNINSHKKAGTQEVQLAHPSKPNESGDAVDNSGVGHADAPGHTLPDAKLEDVKIGLQSKNEVRKKDIIHFHGINAFTITIDASNKMNLLEESLLLVGILFRSIHNITVNDKNLNEKAESTFGFVTREDGLKDEIEKFINKKIDAEFERILNDARTNITEMNASELRKKIKEIEDEKIARKEKETDPLAMLKLSFMGNQNIDNILSLSRFFKSKAELAPFTTEILYCRPSVSLLSFSSYGDCNRKIVVCITRDISSREDITRNSEQSEGPPSQGTTELIHNAYEQAVGPSSRKTDEQTLNEYPREQVPLNPPKDEGIFQRSVRRFNETYWKRGSDMNDRANAMEERKKNQEEIRRQREEEKRRKGRGGPQSKYSDVQDCDNADDSDSFLVQKHNFKIKENYISSLPPELELELELM